MRSCRVRLLPQYLTEFLHSARVLFRLQAALGQHFVQLRIGRVGLRRGSKILRGFRKPLGAVIAEAQQHRSLTIVRIGCQNCPKGRNRRIEAPLLELRQSQIQFDARQLRIERERCFVGRNRFRVLFLIGKNHSQASIRTCVIGVIADDCPPSLGGLKPFSFLLKSNGVRGSSALRTATDRKQTNRENREQKKRNDTPMQFPRHRAANPSLRFSIISPWNAAARSAESMSARKAPLVS